VAWAHWPGPSLGTQWFRTPSGEDVGLGLGSRPGSFVPKAMHQSRGRRSGSGPYAHSTESQGTHCREDVGLGLGSFHCESRLPRTVEEDVVALAWPRLSLAIPGHARRGVTWAWGLGLAHRVQGTHRREDTWVWAHSQSPGPSTVERVT
jgi:hypothetical protein